MTANKEKEILKSKINRKTCHIAGWVLFERRNKNTNLASFIVGLIIVENAPFLLWTVKDGQTYALAKEEGQHTVGDSVKGFAYTIWSKLRLTTS